MNKIAIPCFSLLLAVATGGTLLAASISANFENETVFAKSDPLWRPADVPKASDVIMRSLRPRMSDEETPSIQASKEFHITRHEWTYLNYMDQGGSFADSQDFVSEANKLGILVGGAGSGSAHHVERLTEKEQPEYCVLDIDGNVHVPPHKRGWDNAPGVGSVFSSEYLRIHAAHYMEQLDLGATSLQRDEAWMALSQGYDFSPHAIAAFREYLKTNTSNDERRILGIKEIGTFNVAEYFRSLGAPAPEDRGNRWFHAWQTEDPVKAHYQKFLEEGTIAFYRNLRKRLNHHAGRQVPFSCNNTSLQQWTPVHLEFDWAMSELMFRTANPQHLYERYRESIDHGKVQILSTPKPIGEVEDYQEFRKLNRQVIAQAYSLGGLCKVPWDLFLQTVDGRGRYFGEPSHYADLYGFVRGMAPYLDGFEEAAAQGKGIPDAHGWTTHPIQIEGSEDIYAFLRVKPRDEDSALVVHILNWGNASTKADIKMLASAIQWDPAHSIARVMRPVEYDERLHRLVESKQESLRPHGELRGPAQHPAYQLLVDSKVIESIDIVDGWVRFQDIGAEPWSVIVIEKY